MKFAFARTRCWGSFASTTVWRSGHAALAAFVFALSGCPDAVRAQDDKVSTINEMFDRIRACWRASPGNADIEITVVFSFRRDGELIGTPRIAYESNFATDEQKVAARNAVLAALQRCTPMPFTEGMANAIAGRQIRFKFDMRRLKST